MFVVVVALVSEMIESVVVVVAAAATAAAALFFLFRFLLCSLAGWALAASEPFLSPSSSESSAGLATNVGDSGEEGAEPLRLPPTTLVTLPPTQSATKESADFST